MKNKEKAIFYKKNYRAWKKGKLKNSGYFVIFEKFVSDNILQKITGNALKLYLFLGYFSNNYTGEIYVSISTMAEYFNKSERTIGYWLAELEKLNLIKRMQMEFNKVSHTFMMPY